MDEALDQDAILVFPIDNPETGWTITRKHRDLARKFGSGSVCTIPLSDQGSIFGALTLESRSERAFKADDVRFCELIAALITPFLVLKKRDEARLVEKIRDAAKRRIGGIFGPKNIASKLAVSGVAASLVFASLFQGDFEVRADAVLEGKIQRVVAASIDGFVASSKHRAGDSVKKDEVLATLDDRDLALELLRLNGEGQTPARISRGHGQRRSRASPGDRRPNRRGRSPNEFGP